MTTMWGRSVIRVLVFTNQTSLLTTVFYLSSLLALSIGYVYIDSKPEDQSVIEGSDAVFMCNPTTPLADSSRLHIRWKYKGRYINTSLPKYEVDNEKNALLIKKVSLNDDGIYTCVATVGVDMDMKAAELRVKAPPSQPMDVQVINCLAHSAEILWRPGNENGDAIKHFIVQFNTSSEPEHWYDYFEEIPHYVRTTMVNLYPYGNYSFRMMSRNSVGLSIPSVASKKMCLTPPDHPDGNPENVRTITNKKGKLIIQWTPMPRLLHNGPGFHYGVSWRPKGSTYWNHQIVDDPKEGQIEIDVERVYGLYEIKVKAENNIGESYQPAFIILGRSGEDEPEVIPKDFRLDPHKPVQSHSAHFIWEAVDTTIDKIHGKFQGYRIRFWKSSEGRHRLKQIDVFIDSPSGIHGPDVRAAINGLPAFTALRAQVVVMNTHYTGPPSQTIDFFTPEGAPGPVRQLRVEDLGDSFVQLEWLPPDEPNGILMGYDIGYQSVSITEVGPIQPLKPQVPNPSMLAAKITGLSSGQQYRFYVWARTNAGRSRDPGYVDVVTATVKSGAVDANGRYPTSNYKREDRSGDDPSSSASPCSLSQLTLTTSLVLITILVFPYL